MSRVCRRCNLEWPETFFVKGRCRNCVRAKNRIYKKQQRERDGDFSRSSFGGKIEQARARILTGDSLEYAASRVGIDVEVLKRHLAGAA